MAVTIGSYDAILSGAVGGSGSNDPLPSYTEIFTEGDWDDSVTPPSTDGIGDYESILSGGLGHSGGTLPDYTESTTRGHWAIIPAAIGLKVHYAVQIDISDLSTDTDATRGLYAGFFRWVTERPDYDGATVVPTGDNDGNVWGEGIMLSRAQLSPVDRIIDLNVSGDYGSLSGCNIAIDNATDYNADPASWADYFDQNNYELINRPVKIYAVIDDVFYQVWGGIVSEIKYDDQVMEFICSDIFEEVHKPIPREVITPQNFPLADSDSIGKTIPIVFGDVLRTELINVTGKSEPVTVGYANRTNTPVTITAATEYGISGSGRPYLLIKTNNNGFALDHFIDSGVHYLTVAKGESQSVLITGNVASVNDGDTDSYTKIYLGKKLSVEPAAFNAAAPDGHAYTGSPISDEVWFFRIYKLNVTYLLSNNPIHSFPLTTLNNIILSRWNSDRLKYDPIPELIESFDNTASNEYGMPTMALLNSDIDIEGDFVRLIPIFPSNIELLSAVSLPSDGVINDFGTESDGILLDKDRSTSLQISRIPGYMNLCSVLYRVSFPPDFVIEDMDELFICADIDIDYYTSLIYTANLYFKIQSENQFEDGLFDMSSSHVYQDIGASCTLNFVPDEYYRQGNDNNESSIFGNYVSGTFISDLLKIPNIDNFKEALVSGVIQLGIVLIVGSGENRIKSFTLKQIGFYGSQKINTQKSGLYVKTKGETVSGYETTNPRRVIQHIMETYDGIPPADIDLGNLESMATRDTWRVGRQIKGKKRSSEYLKELAGQTFTAIFPDRYGKRHAKTWLDDAANVWTHADDNGTILKNSITKFEATPINEVFNEFTINYDWNPGLEQFNKTISIRNVNAVGELDPLAATFPAAGASTGTDTPRAFTSVEISDLQDGGNWMARIDLADTSWASVGQAVSFSGGDGNTNFIFGEITKIQASNFLIVIFKNTEGAEIFATSTTGTLTSHSEKIKKWTAWVSGIEDYYTAKGYWEMCYTSWLKTKTVNPLPEKLGNCYWFPDPGAFDGYAGVDDSAAHKYLANLISWVTRQKYRTIYSIPISKNNAEIDLGDVLKFKDQKFTAGEYWTGYVEKIKINPGADTIEVEAILRPADLETFPPNVDLIIETGSAPDTITESGSQPNTITETGI